MTPDVYLPIESEVHSVTNRSLYSALVLETLSNTFIEISRLFTCTAVARVVDSCPAVTLKCQLLSHCLY